MEKRIRLPSIPREAFQSRDSVAVIFSEFSFRIEGFFQIAP